MTPEAAAKLLIDGQVVALPTETVYGLAADACNGEAVAKIYTIKQRPEFNPLIVHVLDIQHAEKFVVMSQLALKLAEKFWPGPLTMVLPLASDSKISSLVCAGLGTLAVRSPAHPIMRNIIKLSGKALAAPSANPSGRISPTSAQHVEYMFKNKIPVVDGGNCTVGIESTIIDLSHETPTVLREGIITKSQLEQVVGPINEYNPDGTITSPGQMLQHYAPRKPLHINSTMGGSKVGVLAFGPIIPDDAYVCLNLSEKRDLEEAASNLFHMLHQLDNADIEEIHAMPIPNSGIGIAINDRLRRAATR